MQDIKKTDQLQAKLFSGNEIIVLETLQFIREHGSNSIIPAILDLYASTSNKEIKNSVYSLLIDIKTPGFQKVYIDLIIQIKYEKILSELLGVCWQSSLPFIDYVDLFANYIITKDFAIAFESITIIESFFSDLPEEKKTSIIKLLKDSIGIISKDKTELLYDTIRLLNETKTV